MTPTNQAKRQGLEDLLAQGYNVIVLVDALSEGVTLPMDWLQDGDHLIDNRFVPLNIGLNLPTPIPDFSITETKWSGTLAFPGMDFHCSVPWEATRQYVTEDRIVIWKLPELDEPPSKNTTPPRKRPPHLRVVK